MIWIILYGLTLSCDPYHIETSSLIYRRNQRVGFYMIGTSVMKELNRMLDDEKVILEDILSKTLSF